MQKATFLQTPGGRTFDLDESLDQLLPLLDPEVFFRVSRQHIVNVNFLKDMLAYGNGRLKLEITGHEEGVVVSRERVAEFKRWLNR